MLYWWDKATGPTRPLGQVATSWAEPSVGLTTGTRTRVVFLRLPSLSSVRAIRKKSDHYSELKAEIGEAKGLETVVVCTSSLHFTESMAYTSFASQG